jgi:hypothetical protein
VPNYLLKQWLNLIRYVEDGRLAIDTNLAENAILTDRALSWYYYLQQELRFPFEAECMKRRAI